MGYSRSLLLVMFGKGGLVYQHPYAVISIHSHALCIYSIPYIKIAFKYKKLVEKVLFL